MTTTEKLYHLKKIGKTTEVLFVEDSENVRVGTYDILNSFFPHITTANDGQAGLDVYRYQFEQGKDYGIIITDITMPKMDGLTMIEEIKKINPKQKTVILSAHQETAMMDRAKGLGIDEYMIKPIELLKVISVFTRLLED